MTGEPPADAGSPGTPPGAARFTPPAWPRLLVLAGLQLPAVALTVWGQGNAAWWVAGLWGSAVCCAGTDSGWRWRNRLLVLAAVVWLLLPLLLTVPDANAVAGPVPGPGPDARATSGAR